MTAECRPIAILIAESDHLVRMVTTDILADAGFQTIEVRTAAEALAVLEGPATVRMLITGRGIVGDGIALAHLVHHRWPTIGIIVTSGGGADLQSALPLNARLLKKPYDFADLIREVKAGLARAGKSPQPLPSCPAACRLTLEWNWATGLGPLRLPQPSRTRRNLCLRDGQRRIAPFGKGGPFSAEFS
ncbi:response regulator [Methylobacterium sp. P31]